MKARSITTLSILLLAAWVASAHEAVPSGQAGVYAVIERVVFEPTTGQPDRIQVWGAFAVLQRFGDNFTTYAYSKPARGYMYFRLLPAHPQDTLNARREWKDLASVAGTREAVAFGSWNNMQGDKHPTVRTAEAKPENPDDYKTDIGIVRLGPGRPGSTVEALLRLVGPR